MIGADELSERAKSLEMLAKKGGTGITDEMHDKMMELYKKTANALAGYFDIEIDVDSDKGKEKSEEPFILEFAPEDAK